MRCALTLHWVRMDCSSHHPIAAARAHALATPPARPPHPQVWFLGKAGARKIRGSPHQAAANHGYDDERGDLLTVMHDHIAYRCAGRWG